MFLLLSDLHKSNNIRRISGIKLLVQLTYDTDWKQNAVSLILYHSIHVDGCWMSHHIVKSLQFQMPKLQNEH